MRKLPAEPEEAAGCDAYSGRTTAGWIQRANAAKFSSSLKAVYARLEVAGSQRASVANISSITMGFAM